MVSMYFFAQKIKSIDPYGVVFDNFLQFCEAFESLCLDRNFFHGWTQKSFIEIEGKIAIHNLIRFESLESEFAEFLQKQNLKDFYEKAQKTLKKENITRREHYKKYFCLKSKKIIKNIWEEDIDCFQYVF